MRISGRGLSIIDGLFVQAKQVPSPNCDPRPAGGTVDLVVLHGISLPAGRFGGDAIERLFTNALDCRPGSDFHDLKGLRVSAHLLIRRDGALRQFVPLHLRAWHAGRSSFGGCERCNDFSVGIELEGTDRTPYTLAQYRCLAETIRALWRYYPELDKANLVGHSDIAPRRKTDPGISFDWRYLHHLLAQR